jgi:glyoxylase-like metal-dependent hydrolase (beta-lactamase superfamily II)
VTTLRASTPGLTELAPGVRRLLAPNPSMMTGPGTNTYLFGVDEVAVLDPGPVIESHLQAIIELSAAPIHWVLVTHTHPDHSPAAAELARRTGAKLLGCLAPQGQHQDGTFKPDRELGDGDRMTVGGCELEAIHTPGHASNHLCYRHAELNWIFTGDHIIDGSTVVIDPPDGNMSHYLASLAKVRSRQATRLAPGHGELIRDPARAIDWIIDHRLQREAKVVAALEEHPGLTSMQLVPHVYSDVSEKLYGWAERSLLAHLLKLADDRRAIERGGLWSLEPRDLIHETTSHSVRAPE